MESNHLNDLKMENTLMLDRFYCGEPFFSKTELPPLPESLDLFNEFPTVPFIDPLEISPNITPYLLPAPSIRDHFDDFNVDLGSWDDDFPSYYEDLSIKTAPASTSNETFNIDYTGGNDLAEVGGEWANCNGDEEKTRGGRHSGRLRFTSIDFDEISRHFYMPITQAAREMKVGLTVLKKRCRELGISRWPHRKMKSLNSLIHNVQEIGTSSDREGDTRLTKEIEKLEEQKRQMEKEPEMQLTETIKKLRQACFKANYKKRRMMIANA